MLPRPLLVSTLLLLSVPLGAQTARPLRQVGATFPEPFSQPRSVRELPDGQALLIDWLEQKLLVVDFSRGTSRQLGRTGSGPAEYRLPSRLFPMGDSTVVRDLGNNRMLLVGPNLEIVGSFRGPDVGYPVVPIAADRSGWLYFEIPNWAIRVPQRESTTVARWDRKSGKIEKLARIRGYTQRPSTREMGIPMVMFEAEDSWTVTPDGRVLFIRSADYSIETRRSDGSLVHGPSHAYPTRPVNDRDREMMVRDFMNTTPMSGRGPDGGMGLPPASLQTDAEAQRLTRTSYFAEKLPYFSPSGVWSSPTGEVWIQRTTGANEAIQLDRFDTRGEPVERVQLPLGRKPIGVGRSVIYASTTDEDGLQHLERYSY